MVLVSCKTQEIPAPVIEDVPETTASEAETSALIVDKAYQIVRGESLDAADADVLAAMELRQLLQDKTGISLALTTDWYKKEEDIPKKEILVGQNDREESREIYASLEAFDWCVAVKNEKIIIAGWMEQTLNDALEYFMENYVNGKEEIRLPADLLHKESLGESRDFILIDWEKQAQEIKVCDIPSYPRLYQLRDGTLICGIDGFCYRSADDGLTWSEAYDYRQNYHVTGNDGKSYALACANSAFFETENGVLLTAYRATGYTAPDKSVFCTKILVSQSLDGGVTWTEHSTMCEYYDEDGEFKGVWEPHFGLVNGVLTCFYANDSRSVIEPPYQNLESLQWIDGAWVNRTIIADGTANRSRDGMPVWQQLSDGRYVCALEGWVPGTSELCIKIMYSDDSVNWSKPQMIYRSPEGYAGAPYIVELPNRQFLVTFQQHGNNCYSILSDGTPLEELSPEHFAGPFCLFNSDEQYFSSWNGMYLTDDYLYAITGTNRVSGASGTILKRVALADLFEKDR